MADSCAGFLLVIQGAFLSASQRPIRHRWILPWAGSRFGSFVEIQSIFESIQCSVSPFGFYVWRGFQDAFGSLSRAWEEAVVRLSLGSLLTL